MSAGGKRRGSFLNGERERRKEVKILIRGKQHTHTLLPAHTHTHTYTQAARINRAQAEALHCRILIAEKTGHEEEVCFFVYVCL